VFVRAYFETIFFVGLWAEIWYNSRMRRLTLAFAALAVLAGFLYYFRVSIRDSVFEWSKKDLPKESTYKEVRLHPTSLPKPQITAIPANPMPVPSPTPTPPFQGINLAVPFSSQAPYGDWSLPYEEACEETSSLLVDRFYKGQGITPETAKDEILKMVDWEKSKFGYYEDTTAAETATMLREYFGYKKVEVKYDITVDDIKNEILSGRPVILPLAGRLLYNPYYRQPGPPYHMLVVKGVTQDGDLITNDVGTRRGYNYIYNADVLFNAIHDAPGGGKINDLEKYVLTGRKAMIVVYPN